MRTGRVEPPRYSGYKPGDPVSIGVGKDKCQFLTPFPQEIEQALTVRYPGYFFSPQYKSGSWDGKKHFITRNGVFPTGLLPFVYHILTTGFMPTLNSTKKREKVLGTSSKNVSLKVDKDFENDFYPGVLNSMENVGLLESLNTDTGIFAYPTKQLVLWKKIQDKNPLAKSILNLCRSLLSS